MPHAGLLARPQCVNCGFVATYIIAVKWLSQIAKFMGPTWGPLGSCQPQMGPMNLAVRDVMVIISTYFEIHWMEYGLYFHAILLEYKPLSNIHWELLVEILLFCLTNKHIKIILWMPRLSANSLQFQWTIYSRIHFEMGLYMESNSLNNFISDCSLLPWLTEHTPLSQCLMFVILALSNH